ncbi:MAG: ribonuclease D [Chloroflexota bacterium]
MPDTPLPPAIYVKTKAGLAELVDTLANEAIIAVDTESNSLHAYRERVCLIQISTRQNDYIVDPLLLDDVSPLGRILADPSIEKVFHAAEYDIVCMKRDFGFVFDNIFDTMIAARICGAQSVGLGKLLEEHEGVKVDKRHQRDDWGKRPLPSDSLRYAQKDTHYLIDLRDIFQHRLKRMERLAEARETFEELCDLPAASTRTFDPDGFWRIGQPNLLKRREMLILREVYNLREAIAESRDVPPFKVLSNKALLELAQNPPSTIPELKRIHSLSARQVRRYGKRLLKAVQDGKAARELPEPPHPAPPDPEITDRYAALHLWRKERAQARGVESDVIISKQALWELAYKDPDALEDLSAIKGIGPWRLDTYGQEILTVLRDFRETEG